VVKESVVDHYVEMMELVNEEEELHAEEMNHVVGLGRVDIAVVDHIVDRGEHLDKEADNQVRLEEVPIGKSYQTVAEEAGVVTAREVHCFRPLERLGMQFHFEVFGPPLENLELKILDC